MKYITNLNDFYYTKEWRELRRYLMETRLNENGELICAHCTKAILNSYECIGHHKKALTLENVNDANVSLNPENIDLVHLTCHNEIENRFGFFKQRVYLVHGSICSGKSTFVKEQAGKNDLIVDMDNIWESISNNERNVKPETLKRVVFGVYDFLIDSVSHRLGKWSNCYVLTTKALPMDRKRLADKLGATIIHIDTGKEECLRRLKENPNGRNVEEYTKLIEKYFEDFRPDE